ncbi:hypothetical protein L1D32_09510 [Shewanella insulae]|uniref:hypothetical protein n=1 Tax=Shewanella insulae TaxID=2681496 RepID=UPI0015E1B967|nr:hypothetical protein [Shewanella insulae]MCG9712473.1 hypothetical protein [Shewanella insulae]MCG9738390.1 hypothetical protein [Shewanella insulae]MCG9754252.1 hypothetical protein [Shewanella insulae]
MAHGKRMALLVGLLSGALVCYGVGMHLGALSLLVVGALLECGFWLRLFKTPK